MVFPELNPNSTVWIYTSDRPFNEREIISLEHDLSEFIHSWAAHGDKLFGAHAILENRFIVLCVDESKVNASGCSIDASFNFIKSLGEKLNIDFFNRMLFYTESKTGIEAVNYRDIHSLSDQVVFNTMVRTNKELSENWRKRADQF